MAKNLDEKLTNLSEKLADLSQKAASASADVKAARELKQEAIQEKISDVKGNVAAFQENVHLKEEENRSRLSSALLKAQMTVEAKIQEKRDARDQRLFEHYINDQLDYIDECFESAAYLIANAKLAILEMIEAGAEYEEKHGGA